MYVYKLSEGETDFYTVTATERSEYGELAGTLDTDETDTSVILERVYDTFAVGKSANQCSIAFPL
ncbi:hypothetical protein [Klebsiella pneumoniae]|uniref:hypothetical protein n=1 Tax=Klebsiella pneumoniae TaxID=573 RepID=UPI001ABD3E36|nr:hypothetical protein [Klebsiella pneumoniae]HBS3522836.1 hypothetical protein [Klebsiella variicola subsp. variicola]MCP6488632.1 hypothetical protein [Klebsiella pneumoniae]MDC6505162.1 hypothetical protein [Klebsiella pneumoniae]MDC6515725.1 hypothetical protein [Klebsiella pneumoniae]MDC6521193.1 hypothetical protein [Klebsiella pneumoniae]